MKYLSALVVLFLHFPGLAASDTYTSKCYVKPCEIKGDFDGDGKVDRVFLIQNKNGKKGIEFKLANGKDKIIGAGHSIGNSGDDFSWLDHWKLHKGRIDQGAAEEKPPAVKGDSLLLEQSESASGLVYWDGSDFKWYQQGD